VLRLDLADTKIRARLTELSDGRIRLTIDLPRAAQYRKRVFSAVADLLTPAPSELSKPRETSRQKRQA
jgi:hypothetical protein